jgi:hypothetical protein
VASRDWPRKLLRPVARFALRHWVRYDEFVRLRQQVRYIALAQLLARADGDQRDLTLFELSVFSQNGEDGVLQEIFRRVDTQTRFFVEIGSSVNESNCLLLLDAFGWRGLVLEADDIEYRVLAEKYDTLPSVRVVQALVQPENVDELLRQEGVPTELDLLSIDVDGNDYWIWDGLEEFPARVVVIEYNSSLPPGCNRVQPYDPQSRPNLTDTSGASLDALCRLAHRKGYQLVHGDLSGTNAFFVRTDISGELFPEEADVRLRATNYFLHGVRHPPARANRIESPHELRGDTWG